MLLIRRQVILICRQVLLTNLVERTPMEYHTLSRSRALSIKWMPVCSSLFIYLDRFFFCWVFSQFIVSHIIPWDSYWQLPHKKKNSLFLLHKTHFLCSVNRAFIIPGHFVPGGWQNCTVKARLVENRSQHLWCLYSPLHCAVNIYFIIKQKKKGLCQIHLLNRLC